MNEREPEGLSYMFIMLGFEQVASSVERCE